MQERVKARLQELRREFDVGQARLREIEAQQMQLRETMLRISGAIQVLEELLADLSPDGRRSDRVVEAAVAPSTGGSD